MDPESEGGMTFWTPERSDHAVNLWREGLSFAEIGRKLGATKSQVLGRITRLNGTAKRSRTATVESRRSNKVALTKPVVQSPWKAKPDAWTPLPGSNPRPLLCMPADACKWPVGDDEIQLFCCEPREAGDRSYCAVHRERSTGVA